MNSLTKIRVISRFPRFYCTSSSEKNEQSPWFRDNAPGPYPKTEEEKAAAARKYGLLREEYEPYPDDGDGFGDYPKIQWVNIEEKDPYLIWTDLKFKRNFGEVVPIDFLGYLPGRRTASRERYSFWYYLVGVLWLPVSVGMALYFLGDYMVHFDALEKQMYIPGVTHYTFDFDEEDSQKHH